MFTALAAVAQRNYVPVTIVKAPNDSLKGFINFRDWYQAPKQIIFKESLSDTKEQHFGPGDISGFVIGEPEMEYVSRKVSIDVTKEDLTGDQEAWQRTIQDTLVFLRKIVGGTYNLYEYADMHSRMHFIYDGQQVPARELEVIKAYVKRPSGDGIVTDARYKQQLEELFADNRSVVKKVSFSGYNDKSLTRLFVAYNSQKDPATVTVPDVKKRTRYPISFGLMAGMAFNSYTFDGIAFNEQKGRHKSNSTPIAGVWLDVPFGRIARNFSAVIEGFYKQSKTSFTNQPGDQFKYNFSYIQFNTMFRYTYPTKSGISPYLNVGMGNGMVIKITENDYAYWNRPNEWRTAIVGPRKHEQSLVAGVGVNIYRLAAEIRYNNGNGFSPYSSGKTTFNNVQVVAKLRF
ncbi:PorT family protein [Chitinophaga rhizophila]|uniref:PorT family protein n=1 Tax=Chitinophaga rhizophila TaxID=2866212 RepID=A0ABS7GFY4_9BACT|nr:PorT family protein [Chitinophaga rhizophila]MBW8686605.1 PorT family protein [Chitinophaga rhizophila]